MAETARKIVYYSKGEKSKLGHEIDWTYNEENYSEDRYESLKILNKYGAIKNLHLI